MAAPFITNANDPIIQMVRDYNILLSDKGTFSNAKILSYLNQHAFPRIRGYLLTARSQSSGQAGTMLFYSDITKLASTSEQSRADQLVKDVMTDSIVKDMVYMIAARFAASWCTTMLAGQIVEQQKIASDLQKEAMDDLKQLVTSPELTAAAAAVQAKSVVSAADKAIAKIFMALAPDPNSYNPIASTVKPYPGAQETGTATIWVNQDAIKADVAIGDTPAVIMNKLLAKMREDQVTAAPLNIIIAPSEGAPVTTNVPVTIKDSSGNETEVRAALTANLGWMTFHSSQYDLLTYAISCTLELMNSAGRLGIKGIRYGIMETTQELATPSYSVLTEAGPYSVLIDLSYGGAGTAAVLKPSAAEIAKTKTPVYDSVFFTFSDSSITEIAQDSLFIYRVGNLSAGSQTTQNIVVPRGSSLMDFIKLFANSLVQLDSMVLPGIRSSADVKTSTAVVTTSGVQIVPYELSLSESKVIFDVLQAPPEIFFATVASNTLNANSPFDSNPKSLVLDIKYHFASGKAALASMKDTGNGGSMRAKPPIISNRMGQAFQDINYFNRGIF